MKNHVFVIGVDELTTSRYTYMTLHSFAIPSFWMLNYSKIKQHAFFQNIMRVFFLFFFLIIETLGEIIVGGLGTSGNIISGSIQVVVEYSLLLSTF